MHYLNFLNFMIRKAILKFCYLSKYKKSVSILEFYNIVYNKKYIIEAKSNDQYLIDACLKGNDYI